MRGCRGILLYTRGRFTLGERRRAGAAGQHRSWVPGSPTGFCRNRVIAAGRSFSTAYTIEMSAKLLSLLMSPLPLPPQPPPGHLFLRWNRLSYPQDPPGHYWPCRRLDALGWWG